METRYFHKQAPIALKVAMRVGMILLPQLFLLVLGSFDQAAHAQGLLGHPVDPRFGQPDEVGQLSDYGYDTARDISRVFTALATIPSAMAGLKVACGATGGDPCGGSIHVAKGLAIAFCGPTAMHLIGTFAINNFGGLGGGL